jgi:hypothetical protein
MKTALRQSALVAAVVAAGVGPPPLGAQEGPARAWAGFETRGSATAGYRLTSLTGRREKFLELFDLRSGPRLLDFYLDGRARPGAAAFAESFGFSASGLGGDPFPAGQLTLRKSKVYDLRAGFRQTYYYWDRNDSAVLPSGLRGLTTNHNWATTRRFGNVNLLVHATNRLKFRLEYGRNSRDGVNFTTRTLEYFGAPSSWGSFLRDNPYYVEAPLRESAHRFAGGLDYTLGDWSFHYTAGYQSFDQSMNWSAAGAGQRSINVDAATTARELLAAASWSESRALKTPSSEFSYSGALNDRVSLRGSFLYFRYRGPASLDAAFAGIARTTGTNVAPYTISMGSRSQLTEPNYVLDQGFTASLVEWSNFHADYRYNRFTERAVSHVRGLRDAATEFAGEVRREWRQGLHQLDLNLELLPVRWLTFRPGIRLVKRDTLALDDGVANARETARVKTVWPVASVAFTPSAKFSARVDVQSVTNGLSYTRITPHTDRGTRLVIRYQPFRRLTIENNLIARNRENLNADFRNRVRSNAATVSWTWSERFSSYAGFSYDSFFAAASVNFVRGTAPLTTSWRDQTVNRVWQLGVTARPVRRLGLDFHGNFVRSTGAGEISGEAPTFGPLSWPMATGTAYYDFPRLGRLAVDLQRTYYHEEIVTGNNFGANLLTIRWTRGF